MPKIMIDPKFLKKHPVYFQGFSEHDIFEVSYIFMNGDVTVIGPNGIRTIYRFKYTLVS